MSKKCGVLMIIIFYCLGCKSLNNSNNNRVHSGGKYTVISMYKNMFKGSILFVCSNTANEKYLILSNSLCSDTIKKFKQQINVEDTIELSILSRTKPVFEDFIFDQGFNSQRKSSLFMISFGTVDPFTGKDTFAIVDPITITTKDSIVPNFYYSPDICGEYIIHNEEIK